jgi:hypothetical protein
MWLILVQKKAGNRTTPAYVDSQNLFDDIALFDLPTVKIL